MTRLGLFALIGFVLGQFLPIWHGLAAPAIDNLCATPLGSYAQAASLRAAHDCALARGVDIGSWLLLALGVVLVVAGVRARSTTGRRP